MELRSMRYFLAVVEEGSVTAAARRLHLTQPSLSRSIQALERQLKVTLFDRHVNRLCPTSAGRQLVPIFRDVVHQAELAAGAVDIIRAGGLHEVSISCPGTTLTDVIAPFLATWRPTDPMPNVVEELPTVVYDSLHSGSDLAIGTDPPPTVLDVHAVAELPVWAYVSPSHPWSDRSTVLLKELVGEDLLVLTRDLHARRAFDTALRSAGLAPPSIAEFGTPEVAQAVAAAGRGIAIVSDDTRFDLVPLLILHQDEPVTIQLYAAWLPRHHAAGEISRIASRLEAFCNERYGSAQASARPRNRSPEGSA